MKKRTVLCVDDDAAVRDYYGLLLGSTGYQVISAANAVHALHVFSAQSRNIDAVILDYQMPGMTGLELAVLLKRHDPVLPIVMIAGWHPCKEDMLPFVDAAMNKGVPIGYILDRLDHLLAQPSAVSSPPARESSP